MAIYYFNLAMTYTEQAKELSDEDEKQEAFEAGEMFVNRAIDCDPKHRESRKLYTWLDDHLK